MIPKFVLYENKVGSGEGNCLPIRSDGGKAQMAWECERGRKKITIKMYIGSLEKRQM